MYVQNPNSNLTAIVLIPFFVAEALKREGKPLATCLDYEQLRPHLSTEDMAQFMAFQRQRDKLFFRGHCDNEVMSGQEDLTLLWEYYTTSWKQDSNFPEFCGMKRRMRSEDNQRVSSYTWTPAITQGLNVRLYGEDAKCDRHDHAFDVVHLVPNVCGVVVYPGFFTEKADSELQHDLVKEVLKVFYVYATYDVVATTSLFKRHLELLSAGKSS